MTEVIRRIDENVSVPLKIVTPIVSAIVLSAVWIQSTLIDIRRAQADAWTVRQMQVWRDKAATENPTLKLPNVFGVIDDHR
jgi:hypothetical protein